MEVEINEEKVPIKYMHYDSSYNNLFIYSSKSSDNKQSQEVYDKMNNNYAFYWNFDKEDIYNIKIIFKRQLTSCA